MIEYATCDILLLSMKHLEGVGRSLIARFKKSFSKKTKKQFFVVLSILGVVAVGALLVNIHPIFAQSTEPGPLDSLLILLAGFAVSIAGVIGQLIVFILDALTIPLMSYNGFSSSGVVGAGWSIVRDVVNMFFVIVLIAIAFGTIFGNSRFQWQQQVPRLLLFAVLINFSRTISGLMIDAAQVFMFTFVNAFKDIAGGNFIELFGLRSIVRINADHPNLINAANGGGGAGFSAFDWFGAGIMSVLMMVIVAATVVALTVIMAWRIVMLWVLIVVSPITWFMGGVKGIVTTADSVYADWWKQFVCYISIGPVLAFFLWLTLAVAGAGNIAASEGFTQGNPAGEVASSAVLEIFQFERMTAFIIGIAMIFAGFRAAQSVCSGLSEGILPAVLGKAEGFAKGAVKATVSAPVGVAAGAGRLGASAGKKGVQFADKQFGISRSAKIAGGDVVKGLGEGLGGVAKNLGFKRAGEYLDLQGQISGSKIAGAGSKQAFEDSGVADIIGAGTDVGAKRASQLLSKGKMSEAEKNQGAALLSEALRNADFKKELQKNGTFDALYNKFGTQAEATFGGDAAHTKALKDFKKTRPDLNKDLQKSNGSLDVDKLKKAITEWEDVEKLDAAALALPEVQEVLQGLQTKFKDKNDIPLNAYEAVMQNRAGNSKREAIESTQPKVRDVIAAANYNGASGTFTPGNENLGSVLTTQLQANFDDIGQIPQNLLTYNDGTTNRASNLSLAAQKAVTSANVSALFTKYQEAALKGDQSKQYELQTALDNAHVILEQAAKSGGDDKKKLFESFKKRKANIEASAPRVNVAANADQIKNQLKVKLETIRNSNTTLLNDYKNKQKIADADVGNNEMMKQTEEIKQMIKEAMDAADANDHIAIRELQKKLAEKNKTRREAASKTQERSDSAAIRANIESQEENAKRLMTTLINTINGVDSPPPLPPPTP